MNKVLDFLLEIYYFLWRCFDNTKRFIRNFPHDFVNVCKWIPTIWKDCWFDYVYLLMILSKKLRADGKRYIEPHRTYSEKAPKVGKQMLRCADLCDRIIKDDYFEEVKPEWYDWQNIKFRDKWTEEMNAEFMDACKKEDELRNKDIEELFDTMKNNLLFWWD